MAGLNWFFLPLVVACIALLSDQTRLSSSEGNAVTDRTAVLASAPAPAQSQQRESSAPGSPVVEQKSSADKSPSIIQMLEGREHELLIWVSIAVVAFAIGWILGGNYHLRRDRARSRKLRF
jgi:hypothetical protein